jgi:hypothetical protein
MDLSRTHLFTPRIRQSPNSFAKAALVASIAAVNGNLWLLWPGSQIPGRPSYSVAALLKEYLGNMWLSTEAFASEFGATLTTQPRFLRQALFRMALEDGTVIAGPCDSERALDAACLHLLNIVHGTKKGPASC